MSDPAYRWMAEPEREAPGSLHRVVGPIVDEIMWRLRMDDRRLFPGYGIGAVRKESTDAFTRRVITEAIERHWPNVKVSEGADK